MWHTGVFDGHRGSEAAAFTADHLFLEISARWTRLAEADVYMLARTQTHTHANAHARKSMHARTRKHARGRTRTHTYSRTHARAHTHAPARAHVERS
jgi:hypothetical protein